MPHRADDALSLYHLIRTHPQLGYRVVGILGDTFSVHQYNFGGIPILGDTDSLEDVLDTMDIDGAFVAGGAFDRDALNKTIRTLLNRGVHIQLSTGIKGIDHRRMRSLSLAYEPMVYVERADLEVWPSTFSILVGTVKVVATRAVNTLLRHSRPERTPAAGSIFLE